MSYNRHEFPKLILLLERLSKEESLSDEPIKSVFTILKEKCAFLIKKLVYLDGQIEYSINFKNKLIYKSDISTNVFKKFNAYFDFFYRDNYSVNEKFVIEWQKLCYEKKASIGQMVLLIKYYKDSKVATIKQVDRLLAEFNHKYKRIYNKYINRQFDIFALNTIKNYMHNCRLSFLMSHDYSFDMLLTDMATIEEIQDETRIKNFYPYRKAVDFIINDIQNDIQYGNTVEEKILIKKLSKLNEFLAKLEDSIRWCKEQDFYPVQLFYNECITYNQDFHLRIFIPSSFSRPINYNKLLENLDQYKIKAEMLKSEIPILKERLEIEELKEKNLLKESEGAMIVDLDEYDMAPCLVMKKDGSSIYATRDLAAIFYRKKEYNFDKCIYVTGLEQKLHFAQVFKVVELMGYEWAKENLIHVPYGLVSLEGGKLSTRSGNIVYAEDILKESVSKIREIIAEKNPDLKDKQYPDRIFGCAGTPYRKHLCR